MVENAQATSVELSAAEIARLEEVAPRGAWTGDRQSFAAHGLIRTAG